MCLFAGLYTLFPHGFNYPGLWILCLYLILLISFVFFIISLSAVFNGRKSPIIPAIIHGLVLVLMGLILSGLL